VQILAAPLSESLTNVRFAARCGMKSSYYALRILAVQRANNSPVIELLRPLVWVIGFVFKVVYYVLFAWWLTPWLRYKANRKLVEDAERSLWFLLQEPKAIKVLHKDWPSVQILSGNLLFTIVRWRDETNVSVAPKHAPTESYQLGFLDDAARLLQAHLEDLNAGFSEERFPSFSVDFKPRDWMRSR